jgi:hypothetical protein
VVALSKAWICGCSLAGIAGSNHAGGHGCPCLVSVVCCQVEVSGTGRSLVQSVVCLCVISKPQQGEDLAPVGLSNHVGRDEGTYKYEAQVSAIRASIVITSSFKLCEVPFLRCSHLFTTVK